MRQMLMTAGLILAASPAFAAGTTIIYKNFNNTSAFTFAGTAVTAQEHGQGVLRVSQDAESQSGAVYLTTPIKLPASGDFETAFKFVIHGTATTNPWADGLTFVLAKSPVGLGSTANSGSDLGYAGVTNSMAVEYDIYYNSTFDGGPNEVAVDTNGSVDVQANPINSWGQPYAQGTACEVNGQQPANCLADGQIWTTTIKYIGGYLYITAQDGKNPAYPVVQHYAVNLPQLLGGNTAYVGFTGGAGLYHAAIDILGWEMKY